MTTFRVHWRGWLATTLSTRRLGDLLFSVFKDIPNNLSYPSKGFDCDKNEKHDQESEIDKTVRSRPIILSLRSGPPRHPP